MLSCRELTEAATDYREGRLGLLGRLRVRLHLRICEGCRRYLRQMDRTVAVMRELPKAPPPPETAQPLLEAFRRHHQGKPPAPPAR